MILINRCQQSLLVAISERQLFRLDHTRVKYYRAARDYKTYKTTLSKRQNVEKKKVYQIDN